MYKIIMTNPAANDLTNAVLYIADELDNKSAAIDLISDSFNIKGIYVFIILDKNHQVIRYPICPAGSL